MKDQLALLRELQQLDLELDEIRTEKEAIQSRLNESKVVLDRLTADLEGQRTELDGIRDMRSQKRTELNELQEMLKERRKRLLNVGSTKEYKAVEKEIDALQKSTEQTEEELLQLAEVIESSEASLGEKKGRTTELGDSIAQEEANASDRLSELDRNINKRNKRTEAARTEVSKRVLYKYDFIRSRRPGLAICSAKDGHCTGCFMSLPPQLFIQVQRSETLETCPSCQRILYYWEDAPDAFSAQQVASDAS